MNRDDVIGSIKDCLSDISDMGWRIETGGRQDPRYASNYDVNTYMVRISKPIPTPTYHGGRMMNLVNHNGRYYGNDPYIPETYDGLEDDMSDFLRDLNGYRESSSRFMKGMKTYQDIRENLSFLCSYIPDMYKGVVIKGMRIEFFNEKHNIQISKADLSPEPIYWSKMNWISAFEHKAYMGLMDSDIRHIDIAFEREMPESVKRMMDDILKDKHNTPKKESFFRRLLDRIFD